MDFMRSKSVLPSPNVLDIFKAVGLKDASSHSGRGTYIKPLANKGVGVRLVATLAGHSQIINTQSYINVNAEQLTAAVELLSIFLQLNRN
jgi:integrase/recombinase XerD